MASVEITPLADEKADIAVSAAGSPGEWKPSAIAADIATLGTGTLVAGLFNVGVVFIVPRLVSVEDYGYWRLFGLYAACVGFLHLGFADGALLGWAGRSFEEIHHEILPAVKFLFWQHVVVLAPITLIVVLLLPGPLRFVGLSVALYAPLYNLTALLQFSLQGARIFRPVAMSTVAAPTLFCLGVILWAAQAQWSCTYHEVVSLFVLTWCVPLAFLLVWTNPWRMANGRVGEKGLAKRFLRTGWPIVMANTGMNLIQCADRLALSWSATIQNFAQYSLAASAMAVPITAIQACSKVFFSHLASLTEGGRRRIYSSALRAVLMVWVFLLPFYFLLELVIARFLPKYTPCLEYARILLLGIPFVAAIQILQTSYAYLNGMQKRFLVRTIVVLAIALGLSSVVVSVAGSLRAVAILQVAILGLWWLFNELTLQRLTAQRATDWLKFFLVYALAASSYWLTSRPGIRPEAAVGIYYLSAGIIAGLGCRDELKFFFKLLTGSRARMGQG
jgi:O-antigen/teichoic acid export membrane protein